MENEVKENGRKSGAGCWTRNLEDNFYVNLEAARNVSISTSRTKSCIQVFQCETRVHLLTNRI